MFQARIRPLAYTGHIGEIFNPRGAPFHQHLANSFGGVVKDEQLYVSDAKALHDILVKQQDVFEETSWFILSNELTMGKGLLATTGEQHRRQRKMIAPFFSMRHLAEMTPVFFDVVKKVCETLVFKTRNGPQEVDVHHWMNRTSLELIGQSGLGYSFDDLTEGALPNPYTTAAMGVPSARFKLNLYRRMVPYLVKLGPPQLRRFLVRLIPSSDVQRLREMVDIMWDTSLRIVASKKAALEQGDDVMIQQVGRGKDIMSILLNANMHASESDRLPEKEVIGQVSTLVFAAMGTTSSALSRVLHLLARHPHIQETLRREICEAWEEKGELSCADLSNLPYLDAVVRETLRLYAPIPMVTRVATQETVIPLSESIAGTDGRDIKEITVPKGTMVYIAIIKANRDPAVWGPDALEWKPERSVLSFLCECKRGHDGLPRWMRAQPLSDIGTQYPSVYANMYEHINTFTSSRN
ncbi:Cytochrome P450, partial [Rhizoctonia solani]